MWPTPSFISRGAILNPHTPQTPVPHSTHFLKNYHKCALCICLSETIISRNQDPFDVGVVSVSQIQGGTTFNVIPNDVRLTGTLRSSSTTNRAYLKERLVQISEQVAKGYGCEANRFQFMADPYPALINDAHLWEWFQDVGKGSSLTGQVDRVGPFMFGEDFAFFSEKKPSLFIWLG